MKKSIAVSKVDAPNAHASYAPYIKFKLCVYPIVLWRSFHGDEKSVVWQFDNLYADFADECGFILHFPTNLY